MKHQRLLPVKEFQGWLDMEASIGTNDSLIQRDLVNLKRLLNKFNDVERIELGQFVGADIRSLLNSNKMSRPQLRLLLIKKFMDRHNLSIIAELIGSSQSGVDLEKQIFIKIATDLFKHRKLPKTIYSYCTYRRMGSPVTWLKLHTDDSDRTIIQKVKQGVKGLCRRLTKRTKQSFKLRFDERIDKKLLFFIEKSSRADVIRSERHNREAQRIVYSLLIINLDDRKIGFVSSSKKAIAVTHRYLKKKIFPEKTSAPRADVEISGEQLFERLVFHALQQENTMITTLELRKSRLPAAPALKLNSSGTGPVNEAIILLKETMSGSNISDLKRISYELNGQRFSLYSYGDEWARRCLNITSQGKAHFFEERALGWIRDLIGYSIKETRFVTKKIDLNTITHRIIKDEEITVEPPLPEYVEKIIVQYVQSRIIKHPKRLVKRVCEKYECRTPSWTSWICPRCGRSMIFLGEAITINIWETHLISLLEQELQKVFEDLEITKKSKQRARVKKPVLEITDPKTKVSVYLFAALDRKDITYGRHLSREGHGLIALNVPQLSGRIDEMRSFGCDVQEISLVIAALKRQLDGEENYLKRTIAERIQAQKNRILERIYGGLRESVQRLQEKGVGYNEDQFEIDIKNVLQALVPNVTRLGTEFKGKKVPDGYCAFRPEGNTKRSNIIGWDAKYSVSAEYRLTNRDLGKQKGYIKWLATTKEPKEAGLLTMYAIISNFNNFDGYKSILRKLSRWGEKPRRCKILLIEDRVLVELGRWMLEKWDKVLSEGPAIARTFFKWIRSTERKTKGKWIYITREDFLNLKEVLDRL